MTDPTPTPAAVTTTMMATARGAFLEFTDGQGLPVFVRLDAITALTASCSELAGDVLARHDAGETTTVARIRLSTRPGVGMREGVAAVRHATGVATQMLASLVTAQLIAPTIQFDPTLFRTDEPGTPGGGA